jgi:SAM-dependent methyltransferase
MSQRISWSTELVTRTSRLPPSLPGSWAGCLWRWSRLVRTCGAAWCRCIGWCRPSPPIKCPQSWLTNGDRPLGVEVATFEARDPAGRAFDAVIAGQAWHWVDPVAGAAKAAQVLPPGGRLAVFWNALQPPPGLGEAFAEVYRQVMPGSPSLWAGPILDAYLMMCGTAADGIRQAGAFGDPQQWRFGWDRPYTRGEWLDQVPTFGGHTQLPPARLEDLLAGIGTAVDAAGGSFTMRYTTVAATAARIASPDPA